MNAKSIVELLKGKAGQHVLVSWQRAAKTLKDCPHIIGKRTAAWVRSGISFSNLATVREGIETGERSEVGKLPWGQWREGFRNYVIDHKGTEYVRLYPASFANLATPAVEWTLDGQPASFAQVEPWLLASEKPKQDDKPVECFTLKAESILTVGD